MSNYYFVKILPFTEPVANDLQWSPMHGILSSNATYSISQHLLVAFDPSRLDDSIMNSPIDAYHVWCVLFVFVWASRTEHGGDNTKCNNKNNNSNRSKQKPIVNFIIDSFCRTCGHATYNFRLTLVHIYIRIINFIWHFHNSKNQTEMWCAGFFFLHRLRFVVFILCGTLCWIATPHDASAISECVQFVEYSHKQAPKMDCSLLWMDVDGSAIVSLLMHACITHLFAHNLPLIFIWCAISLPKQEKKKKRTHRQKHFINTFIVQFPIEKVLISSVSVNRQLDFIIMSLLFNLNSRHAKQSLFSLLCIHICFFFCNTGLSILDFFFFASPVFALIINDRSCGPDLSKHAKQSYNISH